MNKSSYGSVTNLLAGVKQGDPAAQQELWDRYMKRLIRIVCTRIVSGKTQHSDAEDIVVRAYQAFLSGVSDNRFQELNDRNDVWQILVMLTRRKAIERHRFDSAKKRGANNVRTESVFADDSHFGVGIEQIADTEPTPEFAALLHDEVLDKLSKLNDTTKRDIIILKMKGLSNSQIADQLKISNRSVQRKLQLIFDIWSKELDVKLDSPLS